MVLGKAVLPWGEEGGVSALFILTDHLLAAAAVTGEGKAVEGVIDGKNAGVDEGVQDRNDAAGVAAGDSHFFCRDDGFLLRF